MLEKEELNKIYDEMDTNLRAINGFIDIILNENQQNEMIQRYGTTIQIHIKQAEELNSKLFTEDTRSDYDVLAIDDDETALLIIESVFHGQNKIRKRQIKLKCVTDTEAADKELEKYSPKVILLDINLKEKWQIREEMSPETFDGRAYCRKLKADKKFEDVKIFLVTGHILNLEEMKKEALADRIITKPFNKVKFKLIEEYL